MSENLTQQASAYGQAAARALFAIEAGEKSLAEKLRKNLVNLQKNYDKEQAIIKNRIANDLSVHGLKFKRNLSALGRKDETVLAACEYLQVGKIALPEIGALDSSLGEIPFIVPMIGRGHLALAHRSDETRGLLADLVWKTIAATAPGQLQVITYNPDLRNQLSFLSNVEQFSTIISTDQLQALFDSTSREVLEVDSMLKGKYASLIELRRASNQPVGTLRLIVLQDIEFLSDERLRNQFCQLAESCARAGTCFVISDVINPQRLELLSNIRPLSLLEVQSPGQANSARFSCAVALDAGQRDFDAEVAAYIDKASNTSVVSIPFDEVEDVGNLWRDTTRDGITFAMGRSGLEVVTLRLGDEKTQSHNALITGAAGKGKSNLLEVIIHSICARYSPREIELYLLDFKDGLTFKPYSDNNDASSLPHARVLGLESEPDIGLATLEHIESIRRERAKTFKDAGDCKDIAQYRSKYPDRRMPRILVIIDEYQKLFENPDRIGLAAAGVLENLVRQGRACGIHVILSWGAQTISTRSSPFASPCRTA